jgi:hypothetical protein
MPAIRLGLAALACFLVLSACGGASQGSPARPTQAPLQQTSEPNDPEESTEPGPADPGSTPGTALSACELTSPEDIEAALELDPGTVDEGELQQKPTILDPAENECRYDGDWGGLIVSSTPTDGVNTYDAVASAFGEDGEAIDGIGEGALWFEDNNRGYFIKGAVMLRLQFTHLVDSDLNSFRDPTIALGEAGVNKI